MERNLARRFGPPSLLIDKHDRAVCSFGDMGGFLDQDQDTAHSDVLHMVIPGLRPLLGAAIAKSRQERALARETCAAAEWSPATDAVHEQDVLLTVAPMDEESWAMEGMLLVSFERIPHSGQTGPLDQRIWLLEQELRAARQAAEVANLTKKEFLANMSHEIRTPLTGILGLAEVLLMKGCDPKVMESLALIRRSGLSLMFIVNNILDLSRLEAGNLKLTMADFELQSTLSAVALPYEHQAATKGLTMALRLDPTLPKVVRGDEYRLAQVLSNLLSNAVKFADQGQVTLSVTLEGWRDGQALAKFCIEDTGVGIPEDRLGDLFQSFVQLDSSYAKRHGGTGLGLAISKQLVTLMGGEMHVESSVGAGSKFSFSIALGPVETRPMDNPTEDREQPETGLRILVAEDNQINQVVLESELSGQGHTPRMVKDGLEALQTLEREPFDLVLMDVQMPSMDGLEATRRIRDSGKAWASIPIVALTAYTMEGDREHILAAGMDDYLAKPIDFDALYAVLRRLTGGRKE